MCHFTTITYSECGHTQLSTTPEHTLLCYFATDRHLVQGTDHAPAPCVPTDDLELPVIAQNTIIGHCDDCRVTFLEEQDLHRGGLQGVIQLHAHPDVKYGDYDEMEAREMEELKDHIKERNAQAHVVEDEFETLRALKPDVLVYIKNDSLRAHFAQDGPEKYNDLYRKGFSECEDMLKALQTFVDQNVDYDIFVQTYTWIVEKTKRAFAVLETFQIITNCLLKYNPSRLDNPLCGHGARLDLAVDVMVRILQRKGHDTPPDDREFYKPDFELPAETITQIEETEAAFQARLVRPMSPSQQSNFRRARGDMRKNALNKNGPSIDSKTLGSLLDGEKANEIDYEHISFPDAYHPSGSASQLHPLGLENRMQPDMGVDV
jgi:hypothetical protein